MQQSAAVQELAELAELAAMQVEDDEGSEQVEVDAEADEAGRMLLQVAANASQPSPVDAEDGQAAGRMMVQVPHPSDHPPALVMAAAPPPPSPPAPPPPPASSPESLRLRVATMFHGTDQHGWVMQNQKSVAVGIH